MMLADVADQMGVLATQGNLVLAEAAATAEASDFSSISLDAIGRDLLTFLAASVIVTPTAKKLNTNPILLYLLLGATLGPHGLNVFSNTEADIELGDFGVLFLLFAEGLEASPERIKSLVAFLSTGLSQLGVTTALFTAAILAVSSNGVLGGLTESVEKLIPLNSGYVDISNPNEALVLALAATLSSSAFIFPVLEEKGWGERPAGVAGKATLLLQDLAVAPVLVILPFVLGAQNSDPASLSILIGKATVGFGAVLVAGSFILKRVFRAVADAEATESFVALVVLVAVGMGIIAKQLGLTDTAGAFAAGVLLANTNFRAQIQADIVPFEGILLGIFFMTTGANFDAFYVASEWPTVLTATAALIFVKILANSVSALVGGLSLSESVRFSLLLAGGGEFAFVIFGLGERLNVLPDNLVSLLTGVVLISMSLTPAIAEVADALSAPLVRKRDESSTMEISNTDWDESQSIEAAADATVVCGYGELGRTVLKTLQISNDIEASQAKEAGGEAAALSHQALGGKQPLVAFDLAPSRVIQGVLQGDAVIYGDGADVELLKAAGVTSPASIFITYDNMGKVTSAVSRLRESFPKAKIYARASSRSEAEILFEAGVTECVDESEEVAVQFVKCLGRKPAEQKLRLQLQQEQGETGAWSVSTSPEALEEDAIEAKVSERTARRLYSLYDAMDINNDGKVDIAEVKTSLMRAENALGLDPASVQRCLEKADADGDGELDFREFLEMYSNDDDPAMFRAAAAMETNSGLTDEEMRVAADNGISEQEATRLFKIYSDLDEDGSGEVEIEEVLAVLSKSSAGLRSDDVMGEWLSGADEDGDGVIDFTEFIRIYSKI
eukprot:CAMPEP_0185744648 /NCGR_PEP_ID=MMETSP1174-20130828/2792_1 /TAXON_ID=35687 /ORGANISM="Dictyocha speculum, Strain CCMP1381" /LENGTH=843 /DNA_ID=CAMNT_0028418159 /DNA_START=229 /DNA_END=2760 /DNA_ORIENTATION=-